MNRIFFFLLLLIGLFLVTSCGSKSIEETTENSPPKDSLDLMIGQMLMVGFRGTEVDEKHHLNRDIVDYNLGGVVLYEYDMLLKKRPRNIESDTQLLALNTKLQSLSTTPLLISVDEEGGKVTRLKKRYGFKVAPSAAYLGEINNPDSTKFWAEQTAQKLKRYKINLNFAPVVDVNVDPQSPAIGAIERSYSEIPQMVSQHAEIVVKSHRDYQVLSALKHFPGHGSASKDSHKGFTDVTETWLPKELEPYKTLIDKKSCDMVMTAHVFNAKIDSLFPATLSKKYIEDMLRTELGWQGVVISDDMHMGAITQHYGFENAIAKCINSGVDILIFSNNIPGKYNENIVPETVKLIRKLVEEGQVSKERIIQSYTRIMKLKSKL